MKDFGEAEKSFLNGPPLPTVSCSHALVILRSLSDVAIANELIVLLLISFPARPLNAIIAPTLRTCGGEGAECDGHSLCLPVIKKKLFSYERGVKTFASKCACLFVCV